MSEIAVKFCIGLAILLFSTQKFIGLAEKVSRILRISPLIVGITFVAIGTSLPELVVSLISILRHDPGLAMGNIIGSNIVNVLIVLPAGLLIGKLRIGTTKTQRNALILLEVTAIFFLIQYIFPIKIYSGMLLIGMAILISIVEYKLGIFGRTHEDVKRFNASKNKKLGLDVFIPGILLVLGIIIGGIFIVDAVESLSLVTGISTTILGLTLTAVVTSLPELFATIFSQEDNQEKITIGNILGSNIYNLLLVGGIVSLFPMVSVIRFQEWIWLALTTIGFVFILKHYKGKKPPRWLGIMLILFFIIYILSQ
ncbi:MAG: sodium:calcium antiporter [Desulfobacteraceae bacterium]|jgi:cation:H+ antiporter